MNMSQGCFDVELNPKNKFDIKIKVVAQFAEEGIPEDQKRLYCEIENTISILESLHETDSDTKLRYFDKLESLAKAGLMTTSAQPELALMALESLKQEVLTNEGSRIKNSYMLKLGEYAICIAISFLIIIAIIRHSNPNNPLLKYLYTFIGSMPGTWISFGVRKVDLSFEELSVIENDKVNPFIRLIFIGLSAMILVLFIDVGVVSFSFGGFNTDNISHSIKDALFLGVISGLIESKLAMSIFKKANNIMDL